MKKLYALPIFFSSTLLSYQYTIYNKSSQPIRVTLNYTINQESREIEPGGYKRLDNGLRCLNTITAHTLTAPFVQDVWNVNCNPFEGGINCCSDFVITVNPINKGLRIQLNSGDHSIARNRFTETFNNPNGI